MNHAGKRALLRNRHGLLRQIADTVGKKAAVLHDEQARFARRRPHQKIAAGKDTGVSFADAQNLGAPIFLSQQGGVAVQREGEHKLVQAPVHRGEIEREQ